jgi:hypothetical protein
VTLRINKILLSQPSAHCELSFCSLRVPRIGAGIPCYKFDRILPSGVTDENHENGYAVSEFDPSRMSTGDGNISVAVLLHQNAAHVAPTWERNTSASGR